VVVDEIDVEGFAALEAEDDPPIRTHGDRPKAPELRR
jgi:hypothetical protein